MRTAINMNIVNYLLQHKFDSLPFEEKRKIKHLSVHQLWDIVIMQNSAELIKFNEDKTANANC